MANIIKLGSLYLDGQPVEIGADYAPGQSIEVGKTIPGKEISWVVVNEMLIADRCILTNVSWNDLNAQNLVFGKEVTISGFRFTARLIQVGAEEGAPNEWDSALDAVGEDNSLWHWEDMFFWGQEAATGTASSRAYRGYTSARTFYCTSSSRRSVSLGFRPALVPLPSDTLWPSSKAMWWLSEKVMWDDARLDEKLWLSKKKAMWMLWGGQNIIFGRLEELTDYEVILSDHGGAMSDGFGSRLSDGGLVIDRASISGVQKIQ